MASSTLSSVVKGVSMEPGPTRHHHGALLSPGVLEESASTGLQRTRGKHDQTDRQTGRQADRQADRQTGRQAERQTGRQADRQPDK